LNQPAPALKRADLLAEADKLVVRSAQFIEDLD
jgi:hypothetical protein